MSPSVTVCPAELSSGTATLDQILALVGARRSGLPTAVGTFFVSPRSYGRLATWPTARCLLCRESQQVLTLQPLGQIK